MPLSFCLHGILLRCLDVEEKKKRRLVGLADDQPCHCHEGIAIAIRYCHCHCHKGIAIDIARGSKKRLPARRLHAGRFQGRVLGYMIRSR